MKKTALNAFTHQVILIATLALALLLVAAFVIHLQSPPAIDAGEGMGNPATTSTVAPAASDAQPITDAAPLFLRYSTRLRTPGTARSAPAPAAVVAPAHPGGTWETLRDSPHQWLSLAFLAVAGALGALGTLVWRGHAETLPTPAGRPGDAEDPPRHDALLALRSALHQRLSAVDDGADDELGERLAQLESELNDAHALRLDADALGAELARQETRLAERDETIASLRIDNLAIDEARATVASKDDELKERDATIASLRKDLLAVDELRLEARAEKDALLERDARIAQLQGDLGEAYDARERQTSDLKSELDSLRAEHEQRIAELYGELDELSALHAAISDQNITLGERDERIAELQRELDALTPLQATVAERDQRIAELEGELDALTRLRTTVTEQDAALEERDRRIAELQSELDALGSLRADVTERDERIGALTRELTVLDELRATIGARDNALTEREERIADLRQQVAGLDELRDTVAARDVELSQSQDALAALREELGALESLRGDNAQLQSRLDQREEHLAELRSELAQQQGRHDARVIELEGSIARRDNDLQRAHDDLESRAAALEKSDAEIAAIRGDFDTRERELEESATALRERAESLRTELDAAQTDLSSLRQQLAEREERIARQAQSHEQHQTAAREALDESRSRLDSLTVALQERDTTIGDLQERIATLDAQRAEATYGREAEERRVAEVQQERDAAREQLGEAGTRLQTLQADIELLHGTLFENQQELSLAREQLDSERAARATTSDDLRKTQEELERATERFETAQRRIAELAADNDESSAELAARQTELEEARRRCAVLTTELDASRAQADELSERAHSLQQEIDENQSRIETLSAYRDRIASWGSTVTTLERVLRERDAEIAVLHEQRAELEQASSESRSLLAALEDAQRMIDSEQQQRQSLLEELEAARAGTTATQAELNEQNQLTARLREQLEARKRDGFLLRQNIEKQSAVLQEEQLKSQRQAEDIHALLAAGDEDARVIARLRRDIEVWQDRLPPIESENSQLQTTIAALSDDLAVMVKRNNELRERSEQTEQEMQASLAEKDAKEEAINELTIQIETERGEIAELQEQISELTGARDRLAQWQSTVDTFRAEVRSKTETIDRLNESLDQLGTRYRELEGQSSRVADLERQVEDNARLTATLEQREEALNTLHTEAERQQLDIVDVRERLWRLQRTHDDVVTELQHERRDSRALRNDLDEQSWRIETLLETIAQHDVDTARLAEALEAAQRERQEQAHAARSAQAALEVLNDALDDLAGGGTRATELLERLAQDDGDDDHGAAATAQTAALRRTLAARAQCLSEALARLAGDAGRADELAREIDAEREHGAQARGELERARAVIEALRADLTSHEQQDRQFAAVSDANDGLTAELETVRFRSRRLEQEIEGLHADLANGDETIAQMLARIGEVTAQRITPQNWQNELAVLGGSLGSKDARIDELARINVNLRDQLATVEQHAQQQTAALRAELNASAATIETLEAELDRRHASASDDLQAELQRQRALGEELRRTLSEREQALRLMQQRTEELPESVPVLRRSLASAPPLLTIPVRTDGDGDGDS